MGFEFSKSQFLLNPSSWMFEVCQIQIFFTGGLNDHILVILQNYQTQLTKSLGAKNELLLAYLFIFMIKGTRNRYPLGANPRYYAIARKPSRRSQAKALSLRLLKSFF